MPLARQHIFVSGEKIRANQIADEFDQLYRFFSGTQQGKVVLHTTLTDFPLRVSNGNLTAIALQLRKGNNVVVEFNMDGSISSLITIVPPFVVDSTTKVNTLNAEFLDDLPSSSFLTSGKKVEQYIPFYFDDIPVVGDKLTWIAPAGTTMLINQFFASSAIRTTYPDSEAEIDLTFAKNGVTQLSIVLIQPLFSYLNSSPISFSIVENDLLTVEVTAISGDVPPRNIACKMRFRQTLVTV